MAVSKRILPNGRISDKLWQCKARCGMAGRGEAWHGAAGLGVARRGKDTNMNKSIKEITKSLANASAEYLRIREMIAVLQDGESYLWEELEGFFDVAMDQRGRSMFRRAVHAEKRLYSPMAYPGRGLGIVMGDGKTVADIVEHKHNKVFNAIDKVVVAAGIAESYSGVPKNDRQYLRALKAQNQAVLNARKASPAKRIKSPIRTSDGVDMLPNSLI